ncbi:serine hydrolase [Elizabethkingia anophelis]|uniref:serine hydrolase domain-containing protein n=1 Tax=Elizabethkingia anophelis TaxID=1117645 RepID=UPI00201221D2|nr:serine hydrolase domain-containing protein [Elizabethkingia anophelis]MCL1689293.1 beta-lactamase family protein [Elizabethkingia anophelis]MDV3574469.1 serine hydrolase [Elizabethkingia anophelis]MDV3598017.1 serine hydrolase [Elizabethkingia anophelis]MDV3607533.1 serine hydrolase [Elizabethkingia anophelis]MDV3638344.1 serine hydrolase [Elizabethkingia anophelis]
MKKLLSFLFLSLILNLSAQKGLEKSPDSMMKVHHIPEMAYAVITPDKLLVQKTIGHHQIEQINEKPNANARDFFHLGSNTKAITGFIAGYLTEQNKIKWDTKFFDLFPEFKDKSNPKYLNITLSQILEHKAGIQPFTSGAEYQKLPVFKGNRSEKRQAFAQYVLTLPPVENDKPYNYSNAGYSVAAFMLEKVSGKTWEQLVQDVLKDKLKLQYTLGWPNRTDINQPWGHWESSQLVSVAPETKYDLSMAEPAGDISMNIINYSKYIQFNLQGLAEKDNFLKAKTYQYLFNSSDHYSIGWGNFIQNKTKYSEHLGTDGTFFAYTLINQSEPKAYIILINNGSGQAQNGLFKFLKLLKKQYP